MIELQAVACEPSSGLPANGVRDYDTRCDSISTAAQRAPTSSSRASASFRPRVRPCPTAAFRALPGLDHDLDGANDVPVKVLKILGRGPVLEDSLPAS